MIQYGIGVDCSALEKQTLNRVIEKVYGCVLTDDESISRGSGGLRGGARGFSRVKADNLRPGDTMGIPGHIRIVMSDRQDAEGKTIFTTAESRSGGRADVGPGQFEWRYQDGQLQMRRSPENELINFSDQLSG